MDVLGIIVLVLAIIGVTLLLARRAIREDEKQTGRGSEPGEGYHTLHSHYSSGLGGQSSSYKVPRDPQEYAKRFVPKGKDR